MIGLGYSSISAHAASPYPATVKLNKVTNTYEAPDENDPSDVKLTPQDVHITGLKAVDEHSRFNWYRIATWRGEKWVKLTEDDFYGQEHLILSDVALLTEIELYDEPRSDAASGIKLSKQTVQAEAISGSYLKIGTWLGPKWIRISSDILFDVHVNAQELALSAAVTPVFDRPDSTSKQRMLLAPQTVHAFEQKDSWYHIDTSEGSAWINPSIAVPSNVTEHNEIIDVQQKTVLFKYPSFDAKPLGVIAPQQVQVNASIGGWKRINSDWVGEAWLFSMPAPDAYTAPQPIEHTPDDLSWQFRQTEVAGSVGKEYPIHVWLDSPNLRNGPIQPGTKVQIGASIMNLSHNTVIFDAPAEFAMDIVRLTDQEEQTIWSIRLPESTTSVTGQGYYFINDITWDQTDANGNQVPQGEYVARLRLVQPVLLLEGEEEEKQPLQFRSYFVNVPIHIMYPVADRTPRRDTAMELLQNYLTDQMRASFPVDQRLADFRIGEVQVGRESYDDFNMIATYEVYPVSSEFRAPEDRKLQGDGWIRYQMQVFRVVRQGDGYVLKQ
jgi:hypothetical protein